jgi:hypothetical protein
MANVDLSPESPPSIVIASLRREVMLARVPPAQGLTTKGLQLKDMPLHVLGEAFVYDMGRLLDPQHV